MRVNVKNMTNVINKIGDITAGDKTIPGVLLDLTEDGILKVCYSDGHKSFIEHINVTREDEDKVGGIVVDFTMLRKALAKCQPSGIIKVDDIQFTYKEKVVTLSVEQKYVQGEDGNQTEKSMGVKSMDLATSEPGSDMRTSVLTRMKYEDIFEPDAAEDEFNKAEFIDALSRTSVEKGKQVYLSTKTQTIFVANQAHLTSVPVSKGKILNQEDLDELRAEMTEAGTFTDEAFLAEIKKRENRMHYSVAIPQNIAKAIIGVFGKTDADNVYLYTKDKFCSIYVDTDDEHVGFWFEMAPASKAHIGTLERYNANKYQTYQTSFFREFLMDSVKSAVDSTKTDKITFKFESNKEDGSPELVIFGGSASASTADVYRTKLNTLLDPAGTLIGKEFTVSIKVFYDMLVQLKTDLVALDFESNDAATSIRLAELNFEKDNAMYAEARKKTAEMCAAQGIEFDPNATPTPHELKWEYRESTLETKQFTMLTR